MIINIENAVQRIRVYVFAVRGWTKKDLAREANISESSLRNIHSPNWNISLRTLRKIESVVPDNFAFQQSSENFNKGEKP